MLDTNKKRYLFHEIYLQISLDSNISINITFIQYFCIHTIIKYNKHIS